MKKSQENTDSNTKFNINQPCDDQDQEIASRNDINIERAGKIFILFLDGIGKTRDDDYPSNVAIIFNVLLRKRYRKGLCDIHYVSGIGTGKSSNSVTNVINQTYEQVNGSTVDDKIIETYRHLIDNCFYDDDNSELYMIGFSRGAFTVLSLSNFIRFAGMPKYWNKSCIDQVYSQYKNNQPLAWNSAMEVRKIKSIKFLGLFDIVHGLKVLNQQPGINGHNVTISHEFHRYVAHLFAQDNTDCYQSLLLADPDKETKNLFEEVCNGDHSNVGGGWPPGSHGDCSNDLKLSNFTIFKMLNHMKAAGLSDINDQWFITHKYHEDLANPNYILSILNYQNMATQKNGIFKWGVYNCTQTVVEIINKFNEVTNNKKPDFGPANPVSYRKSSYLLIYFGKLNELEIASRKEIVADILLKNPDYVNNDNDYVINTYEDEEAANRLLLYLDEYDGTEPLNWELEQFPSTDRYLEVLFKLMKVNESIKYVPLTKPTLTYLCQYLYENYKDLQNLSENDIFEHFMKNEFSSILIPNSAIEYLISYKNNRFSEDSIICDSAVKNISDISNTYKINLVQDKITLQTSAV